MSTKISTTRFLQKNKIIIIQTTKILANMTCCNDRYIEKNEKMDSSMIYDML